MKITQTIRADELVEGDRLKNDHIVFALSPSVSQPGKVTIAADLDGHIYTDVLDPDADINVVRIERRDCTCGHGIAQHAHRQWDWDRSLACLAGCGCINYTAEAQQ